MEDSRKERMKLRLETAKLKHLLMEVRTRRNELKETEKKKKMKESTPPPLKERKEIRKEVFYNNYNNKKGDFQKSSKENTQEQPFVPPTLDEVQAYMDDF